MIKTTVKTDGMMCTMCEAHINEAIRKALPRAKKVSSSHTKNVTTFLTETEVDPEVIRKAIEETGYTFISVSSEPYQKKGLFGLF